MTITPERTNTPPWSKIREKVPFSAPSAWMVCTAASFLKCSRRLWTVSIGRLPALAPHVRVEHGGNILTEAPKALSDNSVR